MPFPNSQNKYKKEPIIFQLCVGNWFFILFAFFRICVPKKRGKQQDGNKNISAIADSDADALFRETDRSRGPPPIFENKSEDCITYYHCTVCTYRAEKTEGGKKLSLLLLLFPSDFETRETVSSQRRCGIQRSLSGLGLEDLSLY